MFVTIVFRKILWIVSIFIFLGFGVVYAEDKGELKLNADREGALIYIDGQKKSMIGSNYTSIFLKEGSYQLKIEDNEGDWAYTGEKEVFVGKDTAVTLDFKLERKFVGRTELIISANVSGLTVFLDDREIGQIEHGKLSYFLPKGTVGKSTLYAQGRQGNWLFQGKQDFNAKHLESIHVELKIKKKYIGEGVPNELSEDLFVKIPGGCFDMGDRLAEGDQDEVGGHNVCVSDFYLGRYEVTQGQWVRIMNRNPAKYRLGDRYPVESVSWDDVQLFIKRLAEITGEQYRLPTEAEWEYACRGGGKERPYCVEGTSISHEQANYDSTEGFDEWEQTAPVGMFPQNELGLHDMSGNVWEWVSDWYQPNYDNQQATTNPQGPAEGTEKVERGGSWGNPEASLRSTNRFALAPSQKSSLLGFRLVKVTPND